MSAPREHTIVGGFGSPALLAPRAKVATRAPVADGRAMYGEAMQALAKLASHARKAGDVTAEDRVYRALEILLEGLDRPQAPPDPR